MNAMASHRPTRGWSSGSSLGAVLVAASACLSGSLWAANSSGLNITLVEVEPPGTVSVSRLPELKVNVAYRILVENPTTNPNAINQVVFTGTTDIAAYAGSVPIIGNSPNCAAPPSPLTYTVKSVSCQIGQLKSGEKSEFFLLFQTPNASTTTIAEGTKIRFDGHTDFSEGNSSSSPASNYEKDLLPAYIALTTTDANGPTGYNKKVRSVLSTEGGTFFTGLNGGAVNQNNKWSASVFVPETPVVTSNEIYLEPDSTEPVSFPCQSPYFCYGLFTNITILDAVKTPPEKLELDPIDPNAYLIIKLRQDASSLAVKNPFPAIGAIKIFYNPAPDPMFPTAVGTEVQDCNGSPPTAGVPCIAGRDPSKLSKNKKSGYYEWTIHAKDNGRYTQ